jgi:hypothetical protein
MRSSLLAEMTSSFVIFWTGVVVGRAAGRVELAADLATRTPALAARVYAALLEPFAGDLQQEMRTDTMLVAAGQLTT